MENLQLIWVLQIGIYRFIFHSILYTHALSLSNSIIIPLSVKSTTVGNTKCIRWTSLGITFHANLKYNYGNRHFWFRGYLIYTVGGNEKAIPGIRTKSVTRKYRQWSNVYARVQGPVYGWAGSQRQIIKPPPKWGHQVIILRLANRSCALRRCCNMPF